jgi:RNA polymerase sigma-70 factor (ECF subfamily)
MQRDLVVAAQDGDHDAFEALAIMVSPRLYSIARLILRDAYLAEDAVQEALVHAWRRLPSLRDVERFDAWSYRLVVNACADLGRARRRIGAEIRAIQPPAPIDDASGWVADRDQLDRAFRRLRPEQRAALVLHHYLGLPAVEIADALGVPVGTVKSRIHYATQVMRASLEADERLAAAGGGVA